MSLGNRHWFSGFRSGLVRRYFLEFLPEFLLGFPRIVPGNSPEIPLLDFLGFSSEIPGRFDCSFGFFFSVRFEPGIPPFGVSQEIFLRISPGIPSALSPGITSGAPPCISSAILPGDSNCEISWTLLFYCLL